MQRAVGRMMDSPTGKKAAKFYKELDENVLTPADQMNVDMGVGDALRLMAMIPTLKNINKFQRAAMAMDKTYKDSDIADESVKDLLALFRARYPKRMEGVTNIVGIKDPAFRGRADIVEGIVQLSEDENFIRDLPGVFNTIGHETDHINRWSRLGNRQTMRDWVQDGLIENRSPRIFDPKVMKNDEKMLDSFWNHKDPAFKNIDSNDSAFSTLWKDILNERAMRKYKKQPHEAKAFPSGDTAERTYNRMLNIIKETSQEADPEVFERPETEVIRNFLSGMTKAKAIK